MSKIQICNRALSKYLGARRITNLEDGSPEAEQCLIHYDDLVATMFESHRWNFANARQVLAVLTNDKPTEWAYRYKRPTSAVKIHWVNEVACARMMIAAGHSPDIDREFVGDSIYCDVGNASASFTKLIVDESLYPPSFKNALAATLASEIGMSLTKDMKRVQRAEQAAYDLWERAVVLDEEQTPPMDYMTDPDYMTARGAT